MRNAYIYLGGSTLNFSLKSFENKKKNNNNNNGRRIQALNEFKKVTSTFDFFIFSRWSL